MLKLGFGIGCVLVACSAQHLRATQTPENGFVPDAKTAIRIAEAALAGRFGDKVVEADQPFTAKLQNEIWIVVGSVSCDHEQSLNSATEAHLCMGGTGSAKISKRDGTILELHQTQ